MALVPQLEDEQGPQLFAVVFGSAQVLVHQARYFDGVEDALPAEARLGKGVEQEGAPFMAKPSAHRNAEAFLAPCENFRRQLVLHGLF